MKANVNVDIVILTYNGINLLKDCLKSVIQQTVLPKNIIIVDDGSNDGTSNYILENYPSIKLINIRNNQGIPKGFNKALKICESDYVAWINNDTILKSNWLEEMYSFINKHPSAASCDSLIMYNDKRDIVWAMGGEYTIMGSCRFRNQRKNINDFKNLENKEIQVTVGCAAIYRRSVFDDIGVLDESFFLGFEDVDWSLRAILAGYKNYNVVSAVVYHKVSQTVKIGSEQYVRCGQRNVTATFIKNMPGALMFLTIPLHLFYQISSFMYYLSKKRGYAWLNAKLDNVKLFNYYMENRNRIQKNRKINFIRFFNFLIF
jgi:GT2 family glycosyltransferase